mgnify:CR=1 FL=1
MKIKLALAAVLIATNALAHDTVNPLSESPVYDPPLMDQFYAQELLHNEDEQEFLRIQLENTMLKMLVRLMELNMQNLDKELGQCQPTPPPTQ